MSWFAREAIASLRPQPSGHRSLALRALVDGLRPAERPSVLDLGPPLSGNLKFLSALQCRVRVADLHSALSAEPLEGRRPQAMPALAERLLPLEPDDRFDAVLAWDVFDYMSVEQAVPLMQRLAPRLRPGAQLLALVSMQPQIPAVPLRHRIVDRDTLDSEAGPRGAEREALRPGPRHRQADLVRMMPTLAVRRCYLLRSGVKEYLLAS